MPSASLEWSAQPTVKSTGTNPKGRKSCPLKVLKEHARSVSDFAAVPSTAVPRVESWVQTLGPKRAHKASFA
eukprot:809029-Amphidinium_carterae.1